MVTVDRADPTNANVYVGNIPPEMTDADVKRHFSQWGNVLEVRSRFLRSLSSPVKY